MTAKRGMETMAQGEKSPCYTADRLEGAETIAFFIALCLWPALFVPMAWGFGALCIVPALAGYWE